MPPSVADERTDYFLVLRPCLPELVLLLLFFWTLLLLLLRLLFLTLLFLLLSFRLTRCV